MSGETLPTYHIPLAQLADAGIYKCQVTNDYGNDTQESVIEVVRKCDTM